MTTEQRIETMGDLIEAASNTDDPDGLFADLKVWVEMALMVSALNTKAVAVKMPPVFIWHDDGVRGLSKVRIRFEEDPRMTDPVSALTKAFLIAEGFDPDYEMAERYDAGIAAHYRTLAEVAVKTLKVKRAGWKSGNYFTTSEAYPADYGAKFEPVYTIGADE